MVIEYHCVSHSESKLYLHFPFLPFFSSHSLDLWNQTCDKVKKLTIMQFDFTIGTASSNLHRSLASKFKACNAQGRTMICLCLSLSKQWNLIMVLGLSVQQHLIWAQLTQLEFTMLDTSNNKFSAVCFSEEKSRISRISLSEYPNKQSTHKWSLTKHQSSHLEAKS